MGMFAGAAEYPCSGYADYWGGLKGKTKEEEWWPMLCTSWDTVYRPEENNSHPLGAFLNTGGRESILFTLREGVRFHDGSMWNASVMKWNIDRLYLISGNITGNANGIYDQRNEGTYWNEVGQTKEYWSANWNLSEYDATDMGGEGAPPDLNNFTHYYIGDPANPANKLTNPYPYGGWDPVVDNHILYTPYDEFPLIRWVEIVDAGDPVHGGGQVRVHWNSYNTYGMEGGCWTRMISMQAYQDYTETGFYGYNTGNDMIGTGPFKFVSHDEINDLGIMVKNEDWWNNTANEAAGWGDVDKIEIVQFPSGELGTDSMNIALLDHAIDYAVDDGTFNPLDTNTIKGNPNINYYPGYTSEYLTQITLNSINETWWSGGIHNEKSVVNPFFLGWDFTWVDINAWYDQCSASPAANGIPRPLRKALSYAFDYDTLIHTDLNDQVVRGGGFTGASSIYYNASVPKAIYDLEFARNVLLNTESDPYSMTDAQYPANADAHNYSKQLGLRGLTDPTDSVSNNAVWQAVGKGGNPLFTINFYYDDHHNDLADQFELACNQLGGTIVQDADNKAPAGTRLWDHCIGTYWTDNFDGVHSIWSAQAWVMDYNYPLTIPEGWFHANYGDPDRGTWRDISYNYDITPIGSGFWPTWNFGFSYDTEIDYLLAVMYQSDPARKVETISEIADKEMNELYPMIWAYEGIIAECLWGEWETFFTPDRDSTLSPGFWGGVSAQFLRYNPEAEEFPLIPSAPLIVTLAVSAVSIIGIVYTLMRKKRLR